MTKSIHLTPKAEKLVYMLLFFYMGCFVGFMWELLLYWFNHDINLTSPSIILFVKQIPTFIHSSIFPLKPIHATQFVHLIPPSFLIAQKPPAFPSKM